MDNIKIKCKLCNIELEGHPSKSIACGCSNMTMIRGNKISANDLSQVLMINNINVKKSSGILTKEDIAWQESRRQRKVKKLDFEIR